MPPPLFVPVESRAAYRRRKDRLRRLDALLLLVEEHNWEHGGEGFAPSWLGGLAVQLGCTLPLPATGAVLHDRLLQRQVALMRPTYVIVHGRPRRVHDAKAGEAYGPIESRDDLRAIA